MLNQNKSIFIVLICLLFTAVSSLTLPVNVNAIGSIVINEIAWMGTVDSANAEWIELFNTTSQDVDISSWTLTAADGTPNIVLQGTINASGFFLLERTNDNTIPGIDANQIYVGALSNSGEYLTLKDAEGNTIDQLDNTSGWSAGDNTSKQTMSLVNGSWVNSANSAGTPKLQNDQANSSTTPITNNSEGSFYQPSNKDLVAVGEVIINELVIDPIDGGSEWIELFNRSGNTINLNDLLLSDGSGATTSLTGFIDGSHRYTTIYAPKGNLNNAGDIVILKYQDKIIDQVTYGNWDDGNTDDNAITVSDPFSLARLPDGLDNNYDATDFGKAIPSPDNRNNPASEEKISTVNASETTTSAKTKLVINEILPNPVLGDFDNEFIEIKNLGPEINLQDYLIKDNLSQYKINATLKNSEILLLPRKITNLALDNDGETIKILNSTGQTIDSLTYKKPVPEGASWARDSKGDYFWSTNITPGMENIISLINEPPKIVWELPEEFLPATPLIFEASDSADPNGDQINFWWDFGDGYTADHSTPTHIYGRAGKYDLSLKITDQHGLSAIKNESIVVGDIKKTSSVTPAPTYASELDLVKNLNSRAKVTVKGVVASTPELFNKDIFLSGSGLQLYLSAGSWPDLNIGDAVSVTGTVSKTKSYGTRLLVKGGEDIKITGDAPEPEPTKITLSELNNKYEGWLISTAGEILSQDNTSFTIAQNNKTLKIYFKSGIPKPNLTLGQQVTATGFLVINNGEFRLWPRSTDDVVTIGGEPQVRGASTTTINATRQNYLGYFFILLALLVIVLGFIWEKKGWPKPQDLIKKILSK